MGKVRYDNVIAEKTDRKILSLLRRYLWNKNLSVFALIPVSKLMRASGQGAGHFAAIPPIIQHLINFERQSLECLARAENRDR
jgi:hypothetical protein